MFFIVNENHLLIGISRIVLNVLKVDELLRGNQLLIAHNVSQSSLLINPNGLNDLSSPICQCRCPFLQSRIPCTASQGDWNLGIVQSNQNLTDILVEIEFIATATLNPNLQSYLSLNPRPFPLMGLFTCVSSQNHQRVPTSNLRVFPRTIHIKDNHVTIQCILILFSKRGKFRHFNLLLPSLNGHALSFCFHSSFCLKVYFNEIGHIGVFKETAFYDKFIVSERS